MKDPLKTKGVVQTSPSGAIIKPKIDTILLEGTFHAPSGYSSSTREFAHHFIKRYGDEYKNIYLIDRHWDNIKIMLPPKYEDTITKHVVKQTSDIKDVKPDNAMILRWGIPTAFDYAGFETVPHRIKAIYFVWECDRLPPMWIDLLAYYDVIFTCSKASARAIKLSMDEKGMHIPIMIIPHGVADHYNKKEERTKTLDGFTFMCVGTFSKRKAPLEMIKVFLKEFKDEEGVRLIWKVGSVADPSQMLILRREIQRMAYNLGGDMTEAPRVVLDMNTYDSELLNELYNEADCMVQVSHGEAWGLPILNAMATGTPSLTLVKGGHRSFCTSKTTFFVKNQDLIYADGESVYHILTGVKWWKIDEEDFQKKMRYVFDNRDKVIQKGEAGLEIAKRFTWDNIVKRAKKIFNNLDNTTVSRYERNTPDVHRSAQKKK